MKPQAPNSDPHLDSIAALTQEIDEFCEQRDWDQYHDLKELAIGAVTEAAELLDWFRFQSKEDICARLSDPDLKSLLADELADTFYFLLRLASKAEIDLGQALTAKMIKNRSKYPIEKAKGQNKKYDQY